MATNQKVGGSSPSWRATSRRTLVVRRIFLRKMRLHRTGCRSSPRKVTLGSAARLQAPSLTPRCRYQLFAVEGHCSLGIYFVTPTQRQAAVPKSRSSLLWWSRFLLPAFCIAIYFVTLTQRQGARLSPQAPWQESRKPHGTRGQKVRHLSGSLSDLIHRCFHPFGRNGKHINLFSPCILIYFFYKIHKFQCFFFCCYISLMHNFISK